jgi:hypothetical protein
MSVLDPVLSFIVAAYLFLIPFSSLLRYLTEPSQSRRGHAQSHTSGPYNGRPFRLKKSTAGPRMTLGWYIIMIGSKFIAACLLVVAACLLFVSVWVTCLLVVCFSMSGMSAGCCSMNGMSDGCFSVSGMPVGRCRTSVDCWRMSLGFAVCLLLIRFCSLLPHPCCSSDSVRCCSMSVIDPVFLIVAACLLLIRFYSLLWHLCCWSDSVLIAASHVAASISAWSCAIPKQCAIQWAIIWIQKVDSGSL